MASRFVISISSEDAPNRTFEEAIEKILKPSGIKVGGFPEDIFINFGEREDLFCNICFLIINNCYECDNQHKFCRACVLAWSLTSMENCNKCPMCRCLQPDYHAVPEIDEELGLKNVKCPELHCNFTATLSIFLQHCHGKSLFSNQDVNFALIEKERLTPRQNSGNDTMSRLMERFSEDSFGINGLFVIRQNELSLQMMRMRLNLMRLVTATHALETNPTRRTGLEIQSTEDIGPQIDQMSNLMNELDVIETHFERVRNFLENESDTAINNSNNDEGGGVTESSMHLDHDYALSGWELATLQNTDVNNIDNLDEIDVPLTRSQFMSRVLNSNFHNIESPQIFDRTNANSESNSYSSSDTISSSSSNYSLQDYVENNTDMNSQLSGRNNKDYQVTKCPKYSNVSDEHNITKFKNESDDIRNQNSLIIKEPEYSYVWNEHIFGMSNWNNQLGDLEYENSQSRDSQEINGLDNNIICNDHEISYIPFFDNSDSTNDFYKESIFNKNKENSEFSLSSYKNECDKLRLLEHDISDDGQPKKYTEMEPFKIKPAKSKKINLGGVAEAQYLKFNTSNSSVKNPGSILEGYQLLANSSTKNNYNISSSHRNNFHFIDYDSSCSVLDDNLENICNLEQNITNNDVDKTKFFCNNNLLHRTSSEINKLKLPSIVNNSSLRNNFEMTDSDQLFNNNDDLLRFINDEPPISSSNSDVSKILEDNWLESNLAQISNNELSTDIKSESSDIDLKSLQPNCVMQPRMNRSTMLRNNLNKARQNHGLNIYPLESARSLMSANILKRNELIDINLTKNSNLKLKNQNFNKPIKDLNGKGKQYINTCNISKQSSHIDDKEKYTSLAQQSKNVGKQSPSKLVSNTVNIQQNLGTIDSNFYNGSVRPKIFKEACIVSNKQGNLLQKSGASSIISDNGKKSTKTRKVLYKNHLPQI